MSSTRLYTPEVLQLATALARFPLAGDFPLEGHARSRTCGSTLTLGIVVAGDGTVSRLGLKVQACAIGQAAAAIFARAAPGRTIAELLGQADAIAAWLAGEGDLPDIPAIDAIAPARDFPARHGAVMLAWMAARELLPKADTSR